MWNCGGVRNQSSPAFRVSECASFDADVDAVLRYWGVFDADFDAALVQWWVFDADFDAVEGL